MKVILFVQIFVLGVLKNSTGAQQCHEEIGVFCPYLQRALTCEIMRLKSLCYKGLNVWVTYEKRVNYRMKSLSKNKSAVKNNQRLAYLVNIALMMSIHSRVICLPKTSSITSCESVLFSSNVGDSLANFNCSHFLVNLSSI